MTIDDLLKQSSILKELNTLALSFYPVEGNLLYNHPLCSVDDPFNEAFFEKRHNLYQLSKDKKSIMEIGFNAGHSTLMMLIANPTASYALFDLNYHPYTDPCFQLLKQTFPTMHIEYGDSSTTVPQFISSNPDAKYDLIHVDGSHELIFAEKDYENSKRLSTKNTIILFDDTTPGNHLDNFLREKVFQGEIALVDRESLQLKQTSLQTIFRFMR